MNMIPAEQRIAPAGEHTATGRVTLINQFAVRPEQDAAFLELWTEASTYFRARPGFVSLRLHRAISDEADYRWINVANWDSEAHFRAAHDTDEFRQVVTQPGWEQFRSSPTLFEVVTAVDAAEAVGEPIP